MWQYLANPPLKQQQAQSMQRARHRCRRERIVLVCVSLSLLTGCSVYRDGLLGRGDANQGRAGDGANDSGVESGVESGVDSGGESGVGGREGSAGSAGSAGTGAAGADAVEAGSGEDAAIDSSVMSDAGGNPCGSSSDCCPDDPLKLVPGICGCGSSDDDSDGDGTVNCNDPCPSDPLKTAPGTCGCGVLEQDSATAAGCSGLRTALAHRYRFEGTGSVATDSQADADAQLVNAVLSGNGQLDLAGGTSDQHVVLPAGLFSPLTNVSIEAWIKWQGGSQEQRVFDIGSSDPPLPSGTCNNAGAEYNAGAWYYLCTNIVSWVSAKTSCEGPGGSLLAIGSAQEQLFIQSRSTLTLSSWFGGNDLVTEGDWHFARGSTDAGPTFWTGLAAGSAPANTYVNWLGARPDDFAPGEDCSMIRVDGFWDDSVCSAARPFFCEMRGLQGSTSDSHWSLTTQGAAGRPRLSLLPGTAGATILNLEGSSALAAGSDVHLVAIFDDTNDRMQLYVNGVLAGSQTTTATLSSLRDVDNWIGRSRLAADAELAGTIYELRIYAAALGAAQVATSYNAGKDPVFLPP